MCDIHCNEPDHHEEELVKRTELTYEVPTILKITKQKNIKRSKDQINEELAPRLLYMNGHFKGMNVKTEFWCLKPGCGHKWSIEPKNICNNWTGCDKCAIQKGRLSTKEYMEKYLKNTNIGIKGEYVSMIIPIVHYCKNKGCGKEWLLPPHIIVNRIKKNKDKMLCCSYCKKLYKKNKTHKICNVCGDNKPIEDFVKDKRNKTNGTGSMCKGCHNKRSEKRRKDNPSYYNNYCKNRRKEDPTYKLICNLRNGFNCAIKGNKNCRHVLDLLCMDIELFRVQYESKFEKGWTWNNVSTDHYIPIDEFDHSNPEHVKMCWHHSNLRPMLLVDNQSKNDKRPKDYLDGTRKWYGQEKGWITIPNA